jgi:hypothetical protein
MAIDPIILEYFKQAALNSIQATATEVFAQSQEDCPVDTGTLRGSGGVTSANPAMGDFTISYNINDTAPYAQMVEEGGYVNSHTRTSKYGKVHAVNGYNVEGKFFIKGALDKVFSGAYNQVVINANMGSSGYYVNL